MGAEQTKKIRIVYFSRKPRELGNYSVESYFKQIRENLSEEFEAINYEMPYESNGLFKRLGNTIYCVFKQGDINHITGDIHYVAAFLRKKKTVLTILDCGMLHQSTGLKHKLFKFIWFTLPISRAAHITAISTATKNDIIHFTQCNSAKISVIYVCINAMFKPALKEFNQAEPRVLQIGTAPNKNLSRLIQALNGISCKLVIIGKIDESIKELLQENHIKYELIDWRLTDEEVLREYIKCDILSLVSTLEGFGMPIVEANAVGRVVIAGNNSSMPEIAGEGALLVDAFSEKTIQIGIKNLIENANLRQNLVEAGFKNAQRFSPKSLASQYIALYKSLLN
jgi:glycosyltransferase involved in cell wall biosynthesis